MDKLEIFAEGLVQSRESDVTDEQYYRDTYGPDLWLYLTRGGQPNTPQDEARRRIYMHPELHPYGIRLMLKFGSLKEDTATLEEHYQWVATAPLADLIAWAERVQAEMPEIIVPVDELPEDVQGRILYDKIHLAREQAASRYYAF